MMRTSLTEFRTGLVFLFVSALFIGCSTKASTKYWGQVNVPQDNVMRYITGSEPESLDPQFVTGQPEARILIGIYDRLVEYHPKTMEPIPSLATHWEVSADGTNYTFYLRRTGKFSNGDPIVAEDLAWSFRRALSPELASRYAFLGYDIKYAEGYNSAAAFVKKDGNFLLKKDFAAKEAAVPAASAQDETDTAAATAKPIPDSKTQDAGTQTVFQGFINSPERLAVPGDEESRAKMVEEKPEMKSVFEGAEFIPITDKDLGVEAIDDYTIRITLKQSAPFFTGVLTHQFFGALHRKTIEEHGKDWIKPENIVTSGAYKVESWYPYDELTIVKDPNYWDAANVKLDGIKFYPMDEQTTMMNLYKSGRVDALYNHTVPAPWNEYIRQFKDEYLLHPEMSIEYYTFSVKKPPVDKVEVRKAFALSIDREALEKYRKTVKRLVNFTPEGIFPKYEEARKKVYARLIKEKGISPEQWEKRMFDPEGACELMKKAGYTVTPATGGRCKVTDFPVDEITISYNTAESNKQVAEFVQAQWKQNLGLTVQIKNMEWKTYLPYRSNVEYTGAARAGWVGDFVDPYTFLSQFYTRNNDSATGWWDPKFDKMLEDANNITDPMERFEKLAEAEFYMIQDQPVIPLTTAGTSWMKKPYIKGMYPNPGTMFPWKFVYIEKDPANWDSDVENIMSYQNPATEAQIDELMRTQIEFEKSKSAQ